jgi:hypothetical protein
VKPAPRLIAAGWSQSPDGPFCWTHPSVPGGPYDTAEALAFHSAMDSAMRLEREACARIAEEAYTGASATPDVAAAIRIRDA